MSDANNNKLYCGFGIHYDIDTGERFEKTASDEFVRINDGARGHLERAYINRNMEKVAAQLESNHKGGRRR